MKLLSVLLFLSMSGMGWLMFEAIKQEMSLRQLRSTLALGSNQMKQKEDRIHQIKMKITGLNEQFKPLKNKMDELQKEKQESIKFTEELDLNMQKCNEEKGSHEKKKTKVTEDLKKLQADNEAKKTTMLAEIQGLKQHILDRDHAVCAFVDQTNEEGMKLCKLSGAK
ncbi:uncharacterized protein si:dkey-87o1.2 [Osmerus eperlanus]|uniref:uncharacterized protein si:dkey-87o1.2 n=1 Tax=Osmerus eperlanus TaxID=29151 RepID=UPI002E121623